MPAMTTCFKCGGTEIAKGKIMLWAGQSHWSNVFGPDGLRLLTTALGRGTKLEDESYACLKCGAVFSQTDPEALKDFVRKHCKTQSDENPVA